MLKVSRFYNWLNSTRGVATCCGLGLLVLLALAPCLYVLNFQPESLSSSLAVESKLGMIREGKLCVEGNACVPAVLVTGPLPEGARKRIDERIARANGSHLWLCFSSEGGAASNTTGPSFPANVSTCVPRVVFENGAIREGMCESSCTWLWMAGRAREVFRYAHLGVHDAWISDSCWCAPYRQVTASAWKRRAVESWQVHFAGDGVELSLRNRLLEMGSGFGGSEMRQIPAREVQALGLQKTPVRKATFFVEGAPESLL